MREGLAVHAVVLVGRGAELVGVALGDGADERLQVVAAGGEVRGQRIEQLGIRRRIGVAQVVLGFDETALEEVLPVAVHQCLGEERVVFLAHPVRQGQARIVIGRDVERRLAQAGWLQHHPRLAVLGLGHAALVEDEVLPGDGGGFAPDLAEESRHVVVLGLGPALKRVVVALRALHAHAEKELRHVLHLRGGLLHPLVPGHRRVRNDGAGAGEDLAHDLVVGRVGQQAVAHPGMKGEVRGDVGGVRALVLQQRGPFVGEVVGVVRAVEQRLHRAIPLVRSGVREKGLGLLQGRQPPADVERDAAEEGGVIAQRRGRDADAFEVSEDVVVDEVFRRRHRLHRHAQRDRDRAHADAPAVADHDGHIAGQVQGLDEPRVCHRGHAGVVGFKQ